MLQAFHRYWKSLSHEIKILGTALLVLLIIFLGPAAVNQGIGSRNRSAEFYFSGLGQTVAVGQSFPIELRVRTAGTAINAMGFHLHLNPAYLEITNMTTDKSFCTLYAENSFNALTGEVKLSCGAPQPGFQGDSLAVRITVRAKYAGSTPITLTDTNLLANDGKGSNIEKQTPSASVLIQQF